MYCVKMGQAGLGLYLTFEAAERAKLKFEAMDFINDDYVKDRYEILYIEEVKNEQGKAG